MSSEPEPPTLEADELDTATGEISVKEDVSQLALDFRQLVSAEMRYYQARLKYSTTVAKWTGIYLAMALFALFGTAVAVILGLLLVFSTWFGPVIATLIVSLSFGAIGIIFAMLARQSTKKFKFAEVEEEE